MTAAGGDVRPVTGRGCVGTGTDGKGRDGAGARWCGRWRGRSQAPAPSSQLPAQRGRVRRAAGPGDDRTGCGDRVDRGAARRRLTRLGRRRQDGAGHQASPMLAGRHPAPGGHITLAGATGRGRLDTETTATAGPRRRGHVGRGDGHRRMGSRTVRSGHDDCPPPRMGGHLGPRKPVQKTRTAGAVPAPRHARTDRFAAASRTMRGVSVVPEHAATTTARLQRHKRIPERVPEHPNEHLSNIYTSTELRAVLNYRRYWTTGGAGPRVMDNEALLNIYKSARRGAVAQEPTGT